MADVPAYRHKQPDEGHERLAVPLRDAIDALAEAVSVIAAQQAALQDSFFLSDLLFELLGQAMTDSTALTARIAALEP